VSWRHLAVGLAIGVCTAVSLRAAALSCKDFPVFELTGVESLSIDGVKADPIPAFASTTLEGSSEAATGALLEPAGGTRIGTLLRAGDL
jgi:hypothetical protein